MARNPKVKFESFLDGIISIYQLDENRKPVKVAENIRFQRRVVGAKRNYTAEQAGHLIEMLIRIPRKDPAIRGSFVVIGEQQFQVLHAQTIHDTIPQCTDLTLEQPDLLLEFDESQAGAGGRL